MGITKASTNGTTDTPNSPSPFADHLMSTLPATPTTFRKSGVPAQLTLKEQEKVWLTQRIGSFLLTML